MKLSLPALKKIARMFGLDTGKLVELALEEGREQLEKNLPKARDWLIGELKEEALGQEAAIIANLRTKAPLDGRRRKDKDGNEFDDWAYFVHEATIKALHHFFKVNQVSDAFRDAHLLRDLAYVEEKVPVAERTHETLYRALVESEIRIFF